MIYSFLHTILNFLLQYILVIVNVRKNCLICHILYFLMAAQYYTGNTYNLQGL